MKIGTKCKFCLLPITVEIDDAYAALGDPYKLIPYAACNRCADLREERRILESKIRDITTNLMMSKKGKTNQNTVKGLEVILKRYANMVARWHNQEGMAWDDEILNSMLEHPDKWASILASVWVFYRQAVKDRETVGHIYNGQTPDIS